MPNRELDSLSTLFVSDECCVCFFPFSTSPLCFPGDFVCRRVLGDVLGLSSLLGFVSRVCLCVHRRVPIVIRAVRTVSCRAEIKINARNKAITCQ